MRRRHGEEMTGREKEEEREDSLNTSEHKAKHWACRMGRGSTKDTAEAGLQPRGG